MKRLSAAIVAMVMIASPALSQTPSPRTTPSPGDDFFRHANFDWLNATPEPASNASVTRFSELRDLSRRRVRMLVADAGASTDPDAGRVQALNASFMDTDRIDALGLTPIAPLLDRVRSASTHEAFAALAGGNVGNLGDDVFGLYINQTQATSTSLVGRLFPARSNLPARYLTDAAADSRQVYQRYVEDSLTAIGWPNASRAARDVVTLQTALDRIVQASPASSYEQMSVDQLQRIAPDFDWRSFFTSAGLPDINTIQVANGMVIARQSRLISRTRIATLQAWQAFAVLDTAAPYLTAPHADRHFAFRGQFLAGNTQPRPREDRATALLDTCLGDAVGRMYVARWFSPTDKATAQALTDRLRDALKRRLEQNGWLSDAAKTAALERLANTRVGIGYPDQWRDYSDLSLSADDLVGNVRRCRSHEWSQKVEALRSGQDNRFWSLPPHQVNALYSDEQAQILLPAALLQPPFYDPTADAATNYGALGAMIGHQLAYAVAPEVWPGPHRPEWTAADVSTYQGLRALLGAQYAGLDPALCQSACVAQTLTESAADLTGLEAAFDAWLAAGRPGTIDGDVREADRRFFYGWARIWAGRSGEDRLLNTIASDPHAPLEIRATLGPRNIDAWYDAFEVEPGQKLYLPPGQRLSLW